MSEQRRRITDWSLTIVCALLLAEVVLVPPLAELGLLDRLLADAIFVGVVAFAVWLLFDQSNAGRLFLVVGILSVVLRLAQRSSGDVLLANSEAWLTLATLLVMSWLILQYTLIDGVINPHRVLGGIAAFLALGMAFSQAHRLVALSAPGAYLLLGQPAQYPDIELRLHYYSFVTMTTLGYGDITPAHPVARSVAVLQSLVATLYPAVLIGWMVSRMRSAPEHRD
jgi:hypothetical protein